MYCLERFIYVKIIKMCVHGLSLATDGAVNYSTEITDV